jgi:riboflavin kinase/FMN adenylyltransferase
VVGPVLVGGREVSSTAIRELIARGQVEEAGALLGRRYAIAGEVRSGRGVGRHLGFPTANVAPPEHKAVPGAGVYAAVGVWAGNRSAAAVSIGSRPTLVHGGAGEEADSDLRVVEAYLLTSRQPPGYGDRLTVEFVRWLREQRRFRDPGELSEQIARDCEAVRSVVAALQAPGDVLE